MLEQIIRPFQTPTTIADKATPITTVVKSAPQKALLVWGAVGQPPNLESLNFNVRAGDHLYTEKSRKVTDVRIQNPDDPNQYIIAQRIDSIQFGTMASITSPSATSYKSSSAVSNINSPTVVNNDSTPRIVEQTHIFDLKS